MSDIALYEILVPTRFEDTAKPVSLAHHKQWDKVVLESAGGMTIIRSTAIGRWINDSKLYEDRVIPVRIACSKRSIEDIAAFTKLHYRQLSVMYYKLSDEVCYV